MSRLNVFSKVSEVPTNPAPSNAAKRFDVADLYKGPVSDTSRVAAEGEVRPRGLLSPSQARGARVELSLIGCGIHLGHKAMRLLS